MAVVKKIDDSIRVKILSAMTKKGGVSPNIRQIKKTTGFHRATIKSSLDFFEKEKFILGYRPLLDPAVAGYSLKTVSYFQADFSLKEKEKQLLDIISKDKSVLSASQIISDSDLNFRMVSLSKNIEQFHDNFKKNYMYKIPSFYDFVKRSSNFYVSNPVYKNKNEIDVLIDLLLRDSGLD